MLIPNIKHVAAIASALAISACALYGCAGSTADAETASVEPSEVDSKPYVADDVEMAVMLHEGQAAEVPVAADEVVEVVDPETGETSRMTAAEAQATGKTVVSRPEASSGTQQAPASSGGAAPAQDSPSAPSHVHSWSPVTTQKYVVDQPAVPRIVCSCGQVFGSQDAWTAHNKALGRGNGHSYSAQSIPEQGHYETIITGYTCSCGATK